MITAYAAVLEPAARMEFLDVFDGSRDTEPPDESLTADIGDLVERLRAGEYYAGWGWDDDLRDERAWGDESWIDEMDDLFARAGRAFLAGDLMLARDAYRQLFDALLLDEEVGTFSGPAAAPDMLGVELQEAKARALRALYETTDPHGRAAAIGAWRHLGDHVGIRAIAEALPRELPGLDVFLDEWIAWLRSLAQGELSRDNRALLVEPQRGATARTASARWPASSAERTQSCSWPGWTRSSMPVARATRPTHALGRSRRCRPRATRAPGSPSGWPRCRRQLAAAREAWRAAPTTLRLRRLAVQADDTTLGAEADALDQTAAPARLTAGLLVLCGRIDDASIELRQADALGWSSSGHPGPVVVPSCLPQQATSRSCAAPPSY